jgi:eukaryotic-like serine/threonine-protein kinase
MMPVALGGRMNVVPRRLGRYELRQQIGRGNVGEVWRAYDLQLRRDVAVKIVHTDLQSDPHFLSNFTQEGQALTSLRHANIVQVHDVAVSRSAQGNDTAAYILMEYVGGQTLVDYLNTTRKGAFPPLAEIVYLFTSLGVAIDYAHQKGIVHGNLKPSNILLDRQHTAQFQAGEPMLTDLGLLRLVGNAGIVASPFYMSPEQAKGQEPGNRSDIYSLGVILYELCTGVLPFHDESSVAVMMQHINTLPTPPILINPDLPPVLSEVILRAMAKDTNVRFPMASLLAMAVADACSIQSTIPLSTQRITAAEEEDGASSTARGPQEPILGVSQLLSSLSFPLPTTPMRVSTTSQSLPVISRIAQPQPTISALHSALSATSGKQPVIIAAQGTPTATDKISTPTPKVNAAVISGKQPAVVSAQTLPTSTGKVSTPAPWVIPAGVDIVEVNRPGVSPTSVRRSGRGRRFADMPFYILVAVLMVLLLALVGVIGTWLLSQSDGQVAHPIVGHIFFQDDALGHDDTLRLDMPQISPPPQGKTYITWIRDSSHHVLSLGPLTIRNGSASLLYSGDGAHTNLLSVVQSITVTLEDNVSQLTTPRGVIVYQASVDTASFQYIKNILYETPTLPAQQSVIVDLFETIKSMNDKAGSIVDSLQGTHDDALVIRQATRIIEMIDGTPYARSSGDLPTDDPTYINAQIGLLSSPTQVGYIDLLATQLDHLSATAGNNPSLLQHVGNVKNAVVDLQDWLQKIRTYDVQLLKAADLNDPAVIGVALQLKQAAADSYTGRTIPPNEGPRPIIGSAGAYQAYTEAQYMATLELRKA